MSPMAERESALLNGRVGINDFIIIIKSVEGPGEIKEVR